MDLKLEKSLWRKSYDAVIGIDEVGRGSLAGPMVLVATILRKGDEKALRKIKGVNDSKQLSQKKREAIFKQVVELDIPYIVYKASPKEIDKYNIYWAGIRGCDALIKKYTIQGFDSFFVTCDGGLFVPKLEKEKQATFIKGDSRVFAIALASVIAKCIRDALMVRFAKKYPHYGWEQNKGYGTKMHIKAIQGIGRTPSHRLTFLKNMV
ncbi:MAG: ribonuclease HII [Parcubacteria group bacterium]|nr:ribonuclease HII [Parcubacteria group bacterium]